MRAIGMVAVLIAVASLACGQEAEVDDPTPSATAPRAAAPQLPASAAPGKAAATAPARVAATPAPPALSESSLRSTLLTAGELPSGWSAAADGGASEDEDAPEFAPCGKKFEEKHPAVNTADADFEDSDASEFLTLSNESYRSPASAAASMKETLDVIVSCPEWTETDEDGTKYTFRASRTTFPKLGAETLAFDIDFELSGTVDGRPVTANGKGFAVGTRIGQNIVGLFHLAIGFGPVEIDRTETEGIARKAVTKFGAAM